jgi:hypothetical protein
MPKRPGAKRARTGRAYWKGRRRRPRKAAPVVVKNVDGRVVAVRDPDSFGRKDGPLDPS